MKLMLKNIILVFLKNFINSNKLEKKKNFFE